MKWIEGVKLVMKCYEYGPQLVLSDKICGKTLIEYILCCM